jgi:site-specific DNA-cytosine methylase
MRPGAGIVRGSVFHAATVEWSVRNVAEETAEALAEQGYTAQYTPLNLVLFGVQQLRERMFFTAIRRQAGGRIALNHVQRFDLACCSRR